MAALNNANKLKTLLTWFLLARKKRKFNNILRQITFGRRKFRQKKNGYFQSDNCNVCNYSCISSKNKINMVRDGGRTLRQRALV